MFTAIIQARLDSTRYPNKMTNVMVGGKRLLESITERLAITKSIDTIILAVPTIQVFTFKKEFGQILDIMGGDKDNVLKRFVEVCKRLKLKDDDFVLRVCGDAPFPEPMFINYVAKEIKLRDLNGYDAIFMNNVPLGQQVQAFSVSCLKKGLLFAEQDNNNEAMEHIDSILEIKSKNGKQLFSFVNIDTPKLSVDNVEDEELLNEIS